VSLYASNDGVVLGWLAHNTRHNQLQTLLEANNKAYMSFSITFHLSDVSLRPTVYSCTDLQFVTGEDLQFGLLFLWQLLAMGHFCLGFSLSSLVGVVSNGPHLQ
jgi:hypothetical protein